MSKNPDIGIEMYTRRRRNCHETKHIRNIFGHTNQTKKNDHQDSGFQFCGSSSGEIEISAGEYF